MLPTVPIHDASVLAKHHDNMIRSLSQRMEAANAANDRQLVALLERERQQLNPVVTSEGIARSLDRWIQGLKQGATNLIAGQTKLQVYQYRDGSDSWWYAFDPQSGNCVYADSEAELQGWIDDNYQGK